MNVGMWWRDDFTILQPSFIQSMLLKFRPIVPIIKFIGIDFDFIDKVVLLEIFGIYRWIIFGWSCWEVSGRAAIILSNWQILQTRPNNVEQGVSDLSLKHQFVLSGSEQVESDFPCKHRVRAASLDRWILRSHWLTGSCSVFWLVEPDLDQRCKDSLNHQ